MFEKIINGARVIDAYAGMECKVKEGPSPKDLMDPEFLSFLANILEDSLRDSLNYCSAA